MATIKGVGQAGQQAGRLALAWLPGSSTRAGRTGRTMLMRSVEASGVATSGLAGLAENFNSLPAIGTDKI